MNYDASELGGGNGSYRFGHVGPKTSAIWQPREVDAVISEATRKDRLDLAQNDQPGEHLARFAVDFLARITHGIRSPLNIILGYNELLADRLAQLGDDTQRPYLEGIRRSGEQILATINRLIDYSKVADGSLELNPTRIELAPLLEKTVQDFRVLAARKKLQIICEVAEPRAAVRCDAYCLKTALSNLLENALKFTERGGAVVRLYRDDEGVLCIDVRDSGIGFDLDDIQWMLNPLKPDSAEASRRYDASGLGLILSRAYIDLIGAKIVAASNPGRGSVFTIKLPQQLEDFRPVALSVAVSHSSPDRGAAQIEQTDVQAEAEQGIILVVEDQADQAHYLRALLRGRFQAVVAKNAAEAQSRLEELGPRIKLMLLDLALASDEDGLSFARRLRASERWCELPIVVTTAYAFDEDRERALAVGGNAYLAKPIRSSDLFATIDRLLA